MLMANVEQNEDIEQATRLLAGVFAEAPELMGPLLQDPNILLSEQRINNLLYGYGLCGSCGLAGTELGSIFSKIGKAIGKVAKKVVNVAKKVVTAAAKVVCTVAKAAAPAAPMAAQAPNPYAQAGATATQVVAGLCTKPAPAPALPAASAPINVPLPARPPVSVLPTPSSPLIFPTSAPPTPKFPSGTIAAFNPTMNKWAIAVPPGTSLSGWGLGVDPYVTVTYVDKLPADASIRQVPYASFVEATSPPTSPPEVWYKKPVVWIAAAAVAAIAIGGTVYVRRRKAA